MVREAEECLYQIQRMLHTVRITKDWESVRFASFYITTAANEWWDELTRTRRPETFTWEDFMKAFYARLFPMATRQE